jgi:hypothetical protein
VVIAIGTSVGVATGKGSAVADLREECTAIASDDIHEPAKDTHSVLLTWPPHLTDAGEGPVHELTGFSWTIAVCFALTSCSQSARSLLCHISLRDERELGGTAAGSDELPGDAIERSPDIGLENGDLSLVREPLVEVDSEPLSIDVLRVERERERESESSVGEKRDRSPPRDCQ